MLGELQALRLVVRADAGAVKFVGLGQHLFVDQPPDDVTHENVLKALALGPGNSKYLIDRKACLAFRLLAHMQVAQSPAHPQV